MRAFIYGFEVTILDYHMAKRGTPYCKVRIIETGMVQNVPQSCVEIRR